MQGSLLRLLVVLLSFSFLIGLNAAPTSRTRNLMVRSEVFRVSENTNLGNTEGKLKRQRVIRRMDVELNDYPGSGANNRHTPTPKPGKGCVDCN
ncbi:hypothetical protein Vadar_032305 [Vaccinium darrowii]|uniref:Uncharacterized protein n=1 Tax=Vaccinium darrowii TaxID=229202 RepID=A0ACB7YZS7_9ERIC|nr:hypothetical protein Vadar_032305 [Vaccinium darrowii]